MEDKKEHISEWLDKLQQESWNLELLVSGFSIFLLMQTTQGLERFMDTLRIHTSMSGVVSSLTSIFIFILILGSYVLIINLVVHVFLRGFWIGTIGLRSVQEKIDFEGLGYSDFFTQKLKKKTPTLDKMLDWLDTVSSVIFSFTFLLIFMFLSLFLYVVFMVSIDYLIIDTISENFGGERIGAVLQIAVGILVLFMLFMGLIYFIDTISLGFFKKYKWLSKIYYPVYVFLGYVTLAGIYRSIYYSLVSRFSKAKIRIALGLYLFVVVMFPFNKFDQYIFYPDNADDLELSNNIYDDQRKPEKFIGKASIPSRIIKDDWLPLFIRYQVIDNEAILKDCEGVIPKKNEGWNSGIDIGSGGFRINDAYIVEEEPEQILDCLKNFYSIKIDSLPVTSDVFYYEHPNREEMGIFAMLEITHLEKGKHNIYIRKKKLDKDEVLQEIGHITIPFWKE